MAFVGDEIETQPGLGGMRLACRFMPLGPQRGGQGITFKVLIDFCDDGPIGQRFGLRVHLRTAHDPHLGGGVRQLAAMGQGRRQAVEWQCAFGAQAFGGVGVAGEHDVEPTGQWTKPYGQRRPGGAPHDDRAPLGVAFEVGQVFGQVPGHGVVLADDAIGRPGVDEVDAHGQQA